jgi:hypothetical protein
MPAAGLLRRRRGSLGARAGTGIAGSRAAIRRLAPSRTAHAIGHGADGLGAKRLSASVPGAQRQHRVPRLGVVAVQVGRLHGPSAADTRNGTYTAYATTGERFTLTLDFDARQYSIGSPQTTVAALYAVGTFGDDSVAGSYLFQGADGTGATTGFRYVDDLVVGAFPMQGGIKPFVASRNFALSAAEAAGSYSNFGINHANGTDDSRIYTSRINSDGTMQICNSFTIYAIAQCPAASVLNYTLTQSGDLFTATGVDTFNFRVAKAGNENIFLMGAINYTSGARWFRLGLAESGAFGPGSARGGTTLGEWGTANFTSTSYSSTGVAEDGHSISLTGSLSTMGTIGPTGMRGFRAASNGFAMQNTQLGVLVGARNGAAAGYMQIGSK